MIQHPVRHGRNSSAAGIAILLVCLVWLVLNPGGPVAPATGSVTGPTLQDACMEAAYHEVVRVVDGDTFIAMVDGSRERVRLIGIDTPEAASTTESGTRPAESGSQIGRAHV